ncbi:hypothetical protein KYG33_18575 [Chryseobacterium sp. D764]|uniref:hypothetical protein n=1 Tax=Chryseobacterium sp. D764 TaxID=2856522 RepID=UPI001C577E42|nr:hypothetical protein [Chryseobacterium sp. D764]QXU48765.1 hypothetical protein KYG33_18575 [Chryseobacterium sp. D764]
MNRIVPHKVNYDTTGLITKIQFWLMILGTIASLVTIVPNLPDYVKELVDIVICIISIIYFVLEIIFNKLFIKAEQSRIDDYIDNGLNSQLSEENSENYYTNEEIEKGIYKLGVNGYENAFFSKNVVEVMIKKQIPIFTGVLLIYLISIFFIEKELLTKIFQLILPIYIVKDFLKLCSFSSRLQSILDFYKKIFTTIKLEDRDPLIINNIISYEKLISSYSMQLDSKIFHKLNDGSSQKWSDLKKRYKIE